MPRDNRPLLHASITWRDRCIETPFRRLTRDGKPYLAFGSMGDEGQPQTQAALVTRIVDFGYDVQQAIGASRWLMGRTWGTKSRNMSLEGRIPDEVVRELKRRGQPVQMVTYFAVALGAGAAHLTPMSTPVNIVTYGPGAYEFGDYWKIGALIMLWSMTVVVVIAPLYRRF